MTEPILLFQQVDLVLESKSYNHNQVGQWTSSIVEQTLAQLTKLGKSYKYIGKISLQVFLKIIFGCYSKCIFSSLRNHAKNGSRFTYGQFLLLGQFHGW